MLGSSHDADDAVQETMLRAWRGFARFEGRGPVRSWLYSIATRTCLDVVDGRAAAPCRLMSGRPTSGWWPVTVRATRWPGPARNPDAGLTYDQRESVEPAVVAAVQHLPGNQRAALLLFEVLGFAVAEIADMMDTTTASVNSALQRARATVRDRVPAVSRQKTLRAIADRDLRQIVGAFAGALERGDAPGLVRLLTEDVSWSMPPMPHWYQGLTAVTAFAAAGPLTTCGQWRHHPVTANGHPTVASYPRPGADGPYRPWPINVLTLRGSRITEITSFLDKEQFAVFRLPTHLV